MTVLRKIKELKKKSFFVDMSKNLPLNPEIQSHKPQNRFPEIFVYFGLFPIFAS